MTNSLEAWQNSYSHGTRIFDADLNFTSDGMLVLRHSWDDDLGQGNWGNGIVPDYETFIASKIFPDKVGGSLTPMSASMMIEFMQEHNDVYVACDAKSDVFEIYTALVALAKTMDAENVLCRMIVSFYSVEEKTAAQQVWDFKLFAIRYYNKTHFANFQELISVCRQYNCDVCMLGSYFINGDSDVKLFLDNGITVWTAVVDDMAEYRRLYSLGVSGCVSNYLFEDSL